MHVYDGDETKVGIVAVQTRNYGLIIVIQCKMQRAKEAASTLNSRNYRLSVRENSPNKLKVAGVVVGAVVGDQ